VAFERRKYDETATDLNKVLARDPQNADALMFDARLKLVKGETDKAKAQLERLADNFPKSPQINFELGLAYLADNETERAIGSFDKALLADPHFVNATLALAEKATPVRRLHR
jgi:Tfp pilus assembly protein PilF